MDASSQAVTTFLTGVQDAVAQLGKVHDHYAEGAEEQRLATGVGQLELVRTQEILRRFLPPSPAVILDVGGGPGAYACWLAGQGYAVHLIDPVPLHVEQARRALEGQTGSGAWSATVGDARRLEWADAGADAVLLLGPLYHLTAREDRLTALREAQRVLRPGGRLVAAGISRFASTLDGLVRGFLADPEFVAIARDDLATGQHRNPNNRPGYFTTAFFHHPEGLRAEMEEASLRWETTLAVEGPGWLLGTFEEQWNDPTRRERLLEALRWLEREPSTLGASAHLLAVAIKG